MKHLVNCVDCSDNNQCEMCAQNNQGTSNSGGGFVVPSFVPDSINGQIYEIIEAVGLTDNQEKSIKNLIKRIVWEYFNHEYAIHLNGDSYRKIARANKIENDLSVKENRPKMPI